MENQERTNRENRSVRVGPEMCCCGDQDFSETMANCCESMGQDDNGCSNMAEHTKKCRWFLLVPVVVGAGFFLSALFLDAEISRILWLIVSGLIILAGIFALIMMGRIKGCCEPAHNTEV